MCIHLRSGSLSPFGAPFHNLIYFVLAVNSDLLQALDNNGTFSIVVLKEPEGSVQNVHRLQPQK
jgi:hypothetical protein